MSEKPCHHDVCEFTTEVFGEAGEPILQCYYPDVDWEKAEVDQLLECDPYPMLAIHCGYLVDVRISQSKSSKITFRFHGVYNRPVETEDICIALEASCDLRWPSNLILQRPGYLCEAFNANGLTLDIGLPKDFCFTSFAVNARSIQSPILISASKRLRLNATEDIEAKLCSPRMLVTAEKGICLSCVAPGETTIAEISAKEYVELNLLGYDAYDVVCPAPGQFAQHQYRPALNPTIFRGKVLSATCDAGIL